MKCSFIILVITAIFATHQSFSQCKTYTLNSKKDTINCTDFENLKQGKWVIRITENYGEPGYQEMGNYINNKKEGIWMRYNLMGDVLAREQYKWGYKDGVCTYYNLMGLIREESWRATNPKDPYDTVRVYDLNNADKYDLKIIKVDASTVRHGTWTYYDPERGSITKTEEYVIDQLIPAKKSNLVFVNDSSGKPKNPADSLSIANKKKPPEVLEWEKKNQKKRIKVRDGATGVN